MGIEVAYDNESYPNVFTCAMMPIHSPGWWVYEVSARRNDAPLLYRDLRSGMLTRMYGFNSMSYDYPLLHHMCAIMAQHPNITGPSLAWLLHQRTEQLIAVEWGKGWTNHIWPRDQFVQQCDLMMLNHFDNPSKTTSLKDLMFNLECPDMMELPFKPGTSLTSEQIDALIHYNVHADTWTTHKFVHCCKDAIAFRDKLIERGTFGTECLNYNDVKIGEKFFINRLEAASPGITRKDAHGRKPQTHRGRIRVGDVIVPYVQFERPELRQLRADLADTVVDGMHLKGSYNFKVMLDDVEISIGAGGIHGAHDRKAFAATGERIIIDIDVRGYYPSVAIENGFAPAHIGPIFPKVYRVIRDDRDVASAAGDVAEAGALKLSNNGAFGMTNSIHSVLFDPQCMLAITVNGQMLQCSLAEALLRVPGLRILQLNTDGLTVELPRHQRDMLDDVCNWWQRQTCLRLEFADFSHLWLRDVNNYLAVTTKGKRKRKGAYDHEMLSGSIGGQKAWNKDFSALVVPKAAEAALVDDHDPADFIKNHDVAYDFLLRQRMKDGSRLMLGAEPVGKLVRYYIANSGHSLTKVMRPLSGRTEERRIGIHAKGRANAVGTRKNYRCSMCGAPFVNLKDFDDHNKTLHAWPVRLAMKWDGHTPDIDHKWYLAETEKLIF